MRTRTGTIQRFAITKSFFQKTVFRTPKEANHTNEKAAVMKAMMTIWRGFGTRSPTVMLSARAAVCSLVRSVVEVLFMASNRRIYAERVFPSSFSQLVLFLRLYFMI